MLDLKFLYAAIALMLIIIIRDLLKKYTKFDMDKFDVLKFSINFNRICQIYYKRFFGTKDFIINKNTGKSSLALIEIGENEATLMATLRQITGITYDHAKWIIKSAPAVFMTNISKEEADINKKALEFVGAKVEIQ